MNKNLPKKGLVLAGLPLLAVLLIGPPALAADAAFSGAVKDTLGNVLAEVEILVIAPTISTRTARPVATVRTDVDGKFLVERLQAGAYQIAAVKRGYRTYIGQVNTRVDRWIQLVLHPQARLDADGVPLPEDDAWALRLPRRNILRETEAVLPAFETATAQRPVFANLPVNLKVDQLFKVATDLQRAPQDDSVVQGIETTIEVTVPLGHRGNVSAQGRRERMTNSRFFDGSSPTSRESDGLSASLEYETSVDTRISVGAEYASRGARWFPQDDVAPALDHEQESWRGKVGFEKRFDDSTQLLLALDYASSTLTLPHDAALYFPALDPAPRNEVFNGSGRLTRVGQRGRRLEFDFNVRHLDLSSGNVYSTGGLDFNGLPGWTGGIRARETRDLAERFSLIYGIGYRQVVLDGDVSVLTPHLGGRFEFEPLRLQWIATYYGVADQNAGRDALARSWESRGTWGYEAAIEMPLTDNLTLSGSRGFQPTMGDRMDAWTASPIAVIGAVYVTDGNATLVRNRVALRRETDGLLLFAELAQGAMEGSVAAALPYDLPFQQIADRDLRYHNGRLGLRFVPQGTLVTLELRAISESRRAMPDSDSAQRLVEFTLSQDLLQRDDLGRWRFLMGLSMAELTAGDPEDLRQIVSAERLDTTDGRLSAGLSLEF